MKRNKKPDKSHARTSHQVKFIQLARSFPEGTIGLQPHSGCGTTDGWYNHNNYYSLANTLGDPETKFTTIAAANALLPSDQELIGLLKLEGDIAR